MKLLLASTFESFGSKIDHVPHLDLKTKRVLCIPTAAYAYESYDWLKADMIPIKQRAKSFVEFDITNKSQFDLHAAFLESDIIYVTGGNTYYLLEKMRACGFKEALQDALNQGKIYMGASAGAVVVCPRIDFIKDMDDPSKAELKDFIGLNLIDFLIMPHVDHVKYGPVANDILTQLERESVLGLKEDQAVFIQDNYWGIF